MHGIRNITLSLSTLVLNSRDRYEKGNRILHTSKQTLNKQYLKKLTEKKF